MERGIARRVLTGLCLLALAGPTHGQGRPSDREQPHIDRAELTERAEAGDAEAQFELGWKYYEGTGAQKDDDQAALWLRRAADRGHLAAQVRLGNLYEWGHGVPEDPQLAAAWYQKAADGGLPQAHFALGKLHLDGVGMPRDAAKAVTAFRRAADGGFPMGAFVLAQLHRTGEGLPRDNVEAYAWLLIATESQGVPPFIAGVRNEVAATLTPDEIARAVRLAAERRPRGGSPSTGTGQPGF